jgi:dipeptidyl aminopeptidase/acylaminoacyl peptidase
MLFCHIKSFPKAVRLVFAAGGLALATVLVSAQLPQSAPPEITAGNTAQLARPSEPRKPMSLLDIAELPRVIDPQLSPNGRYVTYTLTHADWNAGRANGHLWRQDTRGGAPMQLTFGASGDTPGTARWAPDSASLLFIRDGQIQLLAAGGGEPRVLTRHATGVSAPTWSPDGTTVYFVAPDARTAAERERDRRKDDVYALDENYKTRHLWSVAVATGAEKQLTSGGLSVVSYRLSGDGSLLVVVRAPTPLEDDKHLGELWVMDGRGGNARELTRNDIEENQPEISPDKSQILFLADTNEKLEPYYDSNLFLLPVTGGTPRLLLPDFPHAIDQASWAPDGRSILAVVNMGVHSEIVQIDVATKQWKALTSGDHYIPPTWSVVPPAGQMVFQFDEPARFGDVWTLAIPTARDSAAPAPVRITGAFDTLDRRFALPRQEKVSWTSADGTTIEGLLFYPVDYAAGRRYPLVVQMHGGPAESDKFGAGPGLLLSYFPVLAANGYAVLRPNYRGSTGYGNAFYRDVVGGYFRNMHLDVLAGVDALIKRGVADPDRLVVMGWSAGGHLTNKLITMTTRFKAASAGAGVADWTSMYAQTDTRVNRTVWFGGTPWQKNAPIAAFWNNSPLKDVANAKTPTLFFVGENDARVPLPQSVEMYRALKSHGVPTHLYVAPREGHQWNELRHQIFKANTELAWFERHALGRTTYVPERAPGDETLPK